MESLSVPHSNTSQSDPFFFNLPHCYHDQDAVVNLSEHGIVLIVEETCYLQAKVYLQKELIMISNSQLISNSLCLVAGFIGDLKEII
ncbi:hypothetical protein NC652_008748 [Populus alba x Populus x berolinensis]|nr:hypothetical protein NC652_008748 [Populus alba x Populus x berolinensis]